ncbi:MAG: protein-disulfide reductase DsbD family protein [Bacteroidota bacterium]|nr:protein-disulfide reductase DsbD family protein [Bacteroidota bacterium]
MSSSLGFSQKAEDVVKWKYEIKKIGALDYELKFTAKVDRSWHIYATTPVPDGPIPTSVHYDDSTAIAPITQLVELQKPISVMDQGFGTTVSYHSGQIDFVQRIRLSSQTSKIDGIIEFMACDDSKCLPPHQVRFSMSIPIAKKKIRFLYILYYLFI